MARNKNKTKRVETLTHDEAQRRNIPTAEMQSTAQLIEESAPKPPASYPRPTPLPQGKTRQRDYDIDPQLVWRGKDQKDWSDLVVTIPPIYIQEKIHPKVIIDALK